MNADDFMSQAAAATMLRNLFTCYLAAGFTEEQAMRIVLCLLRASVTAGREA